VTDAQSPPGPLRASVAKGIIWTVTAAVGAVYALWNPYRFSTDDAVSYLDVADAYLNHHWKIAINGYWSPLYSWILASGLWLVHPSATTEILVMRAMNFVLYLIALVAFHFFLRRMMADHNARLAADLHHGRPALPIPLWIWLILGYWLFLWASLKWIGLRSDTPDMCAAALVYVAAGLSIGRSSPTWQKRQPIIIGAVLGLAYLAKTAMFPVGVVFVFMNAIHTRSRRRAAVYLCLGYLSFAAVAGPFIAALSVQRGRFTIGETGRLNYAWMVNPTRRMIPDEHWQGGPPGYGTPVHPTHRFWAKPDAFEFAGPIRGTYPPWTDPSYWYDGLSLHFDGQAQLHSLAANISFYDNMFLKWVLVLWLVVACLGALRRSAAAFVCCYANVVVPALAGLILYMLATHLPAVNIPTQPATRFVAPFVVLLLVSMASSLRVTTSETSRAEVSRAAFFAGIVATGALATVIGHDLRRIAAEQPVPRDVARRAHAFGLKPGDAVAILGSKWGPDYDHEFWARLARIRIVSHVPVSEAFFVISEAEQKELRAALAATGAKALVYRTTTGRDLGPRWHLLESGYYASWLSSGPGPD
jgi:hypothetical protein